MRVLTEKEDNMAVVPIYNRIIVPFSNIVIMSEHYTKVTGRIPNEGEKTVLILSKENLLREEFREDSFYPIGVTGVITEVNKSGYLVVRTSNRVNINEVTIYRDHTIDLDISKRKDTDAVDREEEALRLKKMKTAINSFSMQMPNGKGVMSAFLAQWTSIGEIAAAMSPWMMNTPEEKYSVLALDSARERLDLLERMVYENLETYKINNEAESAQKEEYQKVYRESAIRRQIEYLQKELDEMHPEEVSEIRKFEIRIEESGILYDYLDFVTGLSWKKEKAETIDLDEAEQVLNETHYGLDKVKKRILEQIAVMNLKRMQAGSILLFVGAPGTGKTSIGQGIAQALNRKYVRVSLGGVRDEADIRGHRRTYIGAMPGRIMDGIAKSGVSNPVMVLDEVDKLSASYNGDPASALLEVLDPEQNNTFTDHYMNVPYDLSSVLFICTANSLDTVPAPLLDRMEVISFQGYTPFEKLQIAEKHLLPKAMRAVGIRSENLEVGEDVLNKIIADYTREAGVRTLKKRLDTLCRTAAVEIVRGNDKQLVIHENELRDYLDMRPISHGKVGKEGKPGVVTGLAWTQVGGEILFIETLMTKGTGEIIVTGQLGDVMKESSTIAISLVKSLYPEKAELFEKNDLHIHVPDGATPKDGPSAGITMTTALASLVTGIPVTPEAAMTGEISLQGDVRPIGGLPEKLMAAQRAGVRKVFIPAENEEDLRDVPKEVREELQIIPVRRAEDVLGALSLM